MPSPTVTSSRRVVVLVGVVALLLVTVVLSFVVGSRSIPLGRVIDAFTAFDGSLDHRVVRDGRVPRAVVSLLVGAALAAAGTLMQGLTRNPLADPGILGIEAGASLGAVVALRWIGWIDLRAIVWFAFLGAGVAALVVLVLGSAGRGGANPVKLALVGTAATALFTSITTGILLLDSRTLDGHRFWIVGSVKDRDLVLAGRVAPIIVVGLVLAFVAAPWLNGLALGEDSARGLGIDVRRARLVTSLAVVLLAGAAVSLAGPIGFVGLAIPHLGRALLGHDYRWILAFSLVAGPLMLLGADVVGRVAAPGELQTGVVTAIVGAPVLLAIIRRRGLGGL